MAIQTNFKRTQIRLPAELFDFVKQEAKSEDMSINQFLTEAVKQHAIKRAYTPTKVKQALELITFALQKETNHE